MPEHGLCDDSREEPNESEKLGEIRFNPETIEAFEQFKAEFEKADRRKRRKECIAFWATIIAAITGVISVIIGITSLFR